MYAALGAGAAITVVSWWAVIEARVSALGVAGIVLGLLGVSALFCSIAAGVPLLHPYWAFAAIWLALLVVLTTRNNDFKNAPRSSKVFSAILVTTFGVSGAVAAGIHTGPVANAVGAGGTIIVLGMLLSAMMLRRLRSKKA